MSELYERDLVLWTQEQARLLRAQAEGRSNEAPDWENVAEEIESLGRSERRELARRISTILEQLIKLAASSTWESSAREPRLEWALTILRERHRIEDLLDDSASLRREVAEIIRDHIQSAREVALQSLDPPTEAPRPDVAALDFDEAAVLTADLPPLG
jgi:Domain of unknown function DUF29